MGRLRRLARDVYDLLCYLRRARSLWVALLIGALLVLSLVLYFVQSLAVAPYLYPLF